MERTGKILPPHPNQQITFQKESMCYQSTLEPAVALHPTNSKVEVIAKWYPSRLVLQCANIPEGNEF